MWGEKIERTRTHASLKQLYARKPKLFRIIEICAIGGCVCFFTCGNSNRQFNSGQCKSNRTESEIKLNSWKNIDELHIRSTAHAENKMNRLHCYRIDRISHIDLFCSFTHSLLALLSQVLGRSFFFFFFFFVSRSRFLLYTH